MQWMFMLIGLVLGWILDESFSDALLGALLGLGIGQAIGIARLESRAVEQQRLLEQAQIALHAFEQRLAALEASGVKAPQTREPLVSPETILDEAPAAATELIWELPPELEPIAAAASETSPPQPVDAWKPEPIARAAQPPVPPRGPNLIDRAISRARAWLFGGNTVLRVGVVLLFLGLAFLLRYATEGMVVPIELRYAGVAAAALGLLGLGWWLRARNSSYALILQGAGIAVLYLTVFAAMRLHPLLDPSAAFGLLVAVTVCSAILAIAQDSLGLAAAAALGGFAAPILASTGAGSHVALFSYFTLLNAGIFAIAWFKAWRLLNVIGFTGTFGIGFAWGLRSYSPELLWSTEPFLILFFLMYVAIGLLFARRRLMEMGDTPADGSREALLRWSARKGDYVDGTLLFGPPLAGFGLQCALVQHLEFAAAFSALALGLIYMGLARWLMAGRTLLLGETCLALGVIFASLAIPLGLDARWTTAAWAVEGAGIFWLGLRQQRPLGRAFASLLQLGAALAFLSELHDSESSLLGGVPLGALLLGVALLFSFYQLRKALPEQIRPWELKGLPVSACLGLAFLYLLAPLFFFSHGTVISWALAGALTLFVGLHLQSRTFVFTALAVQLLGGALFLTAGPQFSDGLQPLAHGGFWAPLALGLAAMVGAWRLQIGHSFTAFKGLSLLRLSQALLVWGAGWWALAWVIEGLHFAPQSMQATLLLGIAAVSVALWTVLALRLKWPSLAGLGTVLVPAAALVLLAAWHSRYHPAANFGWLAWAAVFVVHFMSLRRLAPMLPAPVLSVAHVLGCWLLMGVLALELRYALLVLSEQYNAWRWLGWAILPSLYLVLMAAPRAWPWPVSAYPREYRVYAAAPLALLMLGWFWLANVASEGNAEPLPYVPLINPLELGLLLALFGVYVWSRSATPQLAVRKDYAAIATQGVAGASLFVFFTALVMRTAHHWSGVPFELDPLLESMRVQAGLSIVWTLIALSLMIGGHLHRRREVWLIGAALIGVVVAKLFFVELSNRGGLARIVSFIGVGVLLLVVGYFAPLPPKRAEAVLDTGKPVPESQGVSS
ncbi:UNVERIFIED_ORG: putative membrane protein [Pseudomonas reinekei]|nr:putative membrane protein [Pseudomonas reinekei]